MQPNQLLDIIKTTLHKNKVNELAKIAAENQFSVKELIDLTFHPDQQIGFRAAWILENVYSKYGERFLPFMDYFLKKFSQQENPSAQRHYAKILASATNKKASLAVKSVLKSIHPDKIIETIFNWLIEEKTPVATKSHCLNILANFHTTHPWIKDELLQTMDFLVDQESIAFYAKVKQIRRQLR